MSDAFYRLVVAACRPPLWITSKPLALHVDRVPSSGSFILAPNHSSPFDVPCLMRSTPRLIDFLSIVEMKRKRIVGPFYAAMNCVFVDRDRNDLAAARALRIRLERGRAIAMFPEGNIRTTDKSVTNGGPFKLGVIKLARQARVPIIPCVMINTAAHLRARNWIPFQRWSYGINFGEPIHVGEDAAAAKKALAAAYIQLFAELTALYAERSRS